MLTRQNVVSCIGAPRCQKPASRCQIVAAAGAGNKQKGANKVPSRRESLLFVTGLVASSLVPLAAQAKLVDLNRQRKEQELLYSQQMKKLDDMMMQQLKARQAEGKGNPAPGRTELRRREAYE